MIVPNGVDPPPSFDILNGFVFLLIQQYTKYDICGSRSIVEYILKPLCLYVCYWHQNKTPVQYNYRVVFFGGYNKVMYIHTPDKKISPIFQTTTIWTSVIIYWIHMAISTKSRNMCLLKGYHNINFKMLES